MYAINSEKFGSQTFASIEEARRVAAELYQVSDKHIARIDYETGEEYADSISEAEFVYEFMAEVGEVETFTSWHSEIRPASAGEPETTTAELEKMAANDAGQTGKSGNGGGVVYPRRMSSWWDVEEK